MRKFLENHSILVSLIGWRIGLFAVSFLAVYLIPKFGNNFPYWAEELASTKLPAWVWGFGNFDGVHYLRIAKGGYFAQYTQAFFPLYPSLISFFTYDFFSLGKEFSYFFSAVFLSTVSFFGAIFFLYKLFILDYDEAIVKKSLLLLIFFPVSFYFGAIYSESLFLLLAIVSIYAARKKRYLLSGVFASLASATRIVGLALFLVLLIELLIEFREKKLRVKSMKFLEGIIGLIVAPIGFFGYSLYLKFAFDNPLYFLTSQSAFGAQRSEQPLILLPQVLFRYSKILISVPAYSYPFFTSVLELVFTLLAFGLLLFSIKKVRLSYWIFSFLCFIIPTMTGTFSSMPRYVLMCFLIFPVAIRFLNGYFKIVLGIFIILQSLLLSLFIRGYWVS